MLEYVSKAPFIVLGFVAVYASQDQLAAHMYAQSMMAGFAIQMFSEFYLVAVIAVVAAMAFLTNKEADIVSALKNYARNLIMLAIGGCAAAFAIATGLPQHPTFNLVSSGVAFVLSTTVIWGGGLGVALYFLLQTYPTAPAQKVAPKSRARRKTTQKGQRPKSPKGKPD